MSVCARLADVGSVGIYCAPVFWLALDPRCGLPRSGFSSSVVPEEWRLLYSLNPMVGVIDGFRGCILNGQSPLYLPGLGEGICVAVFFLWFGIHRFRKTEKALLT